MVKLIDFEDVFCWRRRKISIQGNDFTIIAGKKKKDSHTLDLKDAVSMQGFLISKHFLYCIPYKTGVFVVADIVFTVTETGVFCEIV